MGWTVQWDHFGWGGMATQGDKTTNALLGALAPYHELRFGMVQNPDGSSTIILYRTASGCAGGLIGAWQVREKFKTSVQQLEGGFASMGLLMHSGGR